MILSICIATMPSRHILLARLLRELTTQINENSADDLIEILTDDNTIKTTGKKRTELYLKAKGKYVVSIDDDDYIYPYYINEILKAVEKDPDAVGINGIITTNGLQGIFWFISKDLSYDMKQKFDGTPVYVRFNNHLSPIRTSIAQQFLFPDSSMGEDYQFALNIHDANAIKTEVVIGTSAKEWLYDSWLTRKTPAMPMYHYKFITNK